MGWAQRRNKIAQKAKEGGLAPIGKAPAEGIRRLRERRLEERLQKMELAQLQQDRCQWCGAGWVHGVYRSSCGLCDKRQIVLARLREQVAERK